MNCELKKISLILLLTLSLFLLTGCLRVDIDMGIDDLHNSYLTYSIEMDVSGVDLQYHGILANTLNNLGWHYQENFGFEAGVNTESEIYTLTMRKTAQNESFSEAFESLKAMLTDEDMTAFMEVDMALESFPRQDSYIIGAMADIPQIVRLSSAQELPPELLAEFEKALEASGGTIRLTMPVSELAAHSHDIETLYYLTTMTVPLDFSEQTEFELGGSVNYGEDGWQIGTIDDVLGVLERQKETALIAGSVIVGLLLLMLFAMIVRRR